MGLYRIAQEALTNVVKHAWARQVAMQLVTTPNYVQLFIEDDGRGFDPSEVSHDAYGLIGLNERAEVLGGTLRLESGDGVGLASILLHAGVSSLEVQSEELEDQVMYAEPFRVSEATA